MTGRDEEFGAYYEAQVPQRPGPAYRLTGSRADSEDLDQDAMLRTYRALKSAPAVPKMVSFPDVPTRVARCPPHVGTEASAVTAAEARMSRPASPVAIVRLVMSGLLRP